MAQLAKGGKILSDGVLCEGYSPSCGRIRLELHAPNTPNTFAVWLDRDEARHLCQQTLALLDVTEQKAA